MNNEEINNVLGLEEPAAAPAAEPTPEPAVAQPTLEEPVTPEPAAPTFDPSALEERLGQLGSQIENINNNMYTPPAPEPTEEERMIEDIKKKLGLDAIEEQNRLLREQLEAQSQKTEEVQSVAEQMRVQQEKAELMTKYPDMDEGVIMDKLKEIYAWNPEMAQSLHNAAGWEYVWTNMIANKPAAQPDPIVSTDASGSDFVDSASQRVGKGEASKDDIGALLASYVS